MENKKYQKTQISFFSSNVSGIAWKIVHNIEQLLKHFIKVKVVQNPTALNGHS